MNIEEIEKWLGDVRQEKENGWAVTEHDTDAIIELLQTARSHVKAVDRIIAFCDELRADESTVSTVSKAFADEIDARLKGHR